MELYQENILVIRVVQVGIVRLMNRNVFKSTFPLHEGRYDKDGHKEEKTDRRVRFDFLNIFIIHIFA